MTTSADFKTRYPFHVPGSHEYEGVLCLPNMRSEHLDAMKTYDVTDRDVFCATFPKAGTKWLEEILYLMVYPEQTDNVRKDPKKAFVPFFSHANLKPFDFLEKQGKASPRLLKSHLAATFFENQIQNNKARVVYCIREPKDNLVVLYQLYSKFLKFPGDFSEFFQYFKESRLYHGDWFKHVSSWWDQKDNDNVLIFNYNDLKDDLPGIVKRIAEHIGKRLSEDEVKEFTQHACSDCDPTPAGGWQEYFSVDEADELHQICREKLPADLLEFLKL